MPSKGLNTAYILQETVRQLGDSFNSYDREAAVVYRCRTKQGLYITARPINHHTRSGWTHNIDKMLDRIVSP